MNQLPQIMNIFCLIMQIVVFYFAFVKYEFYHEVSEGEMLILVFLGFMSISLFLK